MNAVNRHCCLLLVVLCELPPPPQLFYGPFSRTTRVSRCQKRTSGFMVQGKTQEADTLTIRMGAPPSGLNSAHLHHPPFLQAGCPSCPNQQCQSTYCMWIKRAFIFFWVTEGCVVLLIHFYSERNARIANAVLATAIPSVRPSVCPSHAGIVSKRPYVARCSLHRWIAKCV